MTPPAWLMPLLMVALSVSACVSPAARFDEAAAAAGLHRSRIEGNGFYLAVYANDAPGASSLRIYLDGDGSPYLGKAIAADPTPRDSMVLKLLAEDHGPALYLGRPCYHGEAGTPGCSPDLWTGARYGETVVASMTAAVSRILIAWGAHRATLIGHSGGGALAMLIAPRVPETDAVVTIAANLDAAAWAGYAREDLSGSLDPATEPPLRPGITQWHYAGSEDHVVPPAITAAGLHRGGTLTLVDGLDHVSGWPAMWPSILAQLDLHGDGVRPPHREPAAPRD